MASVTLALTPFFSGIALDVTPQIDPTGEITLHVHPTVSEVVDQTKEINIFGNNQTIPVAFSTVRESDSIVHARSGQLVVIGGLITSTLLTLVVIPCVYDLFDQLKEKIKLI